MSANDNTLITTMKLCDEKIYSTSSVLKSTKELIKSNTGQRMAVKIVKITEQEFKKSIASNIIQDQQAAAWINKSWSEVKSNLLGLAEKGSAIYNPQDHTILVKSIDTFSKGLTVSN